MTRLWRLNAVVPKELEAQLMELRRTDEFCRGSISRMVRVLLEEAIAARKESKQRVIEIELPKWMAEMVREMAAERGLTANEMLEQLLREGLEIAKRLEA